MITELDIEIRVFRNDKVTLSEIEALNPQGIVISPGPGRPEDAGICLALIKHFANKLPILGVCLGHQAIAMVFGAKVVCSKDVIHGKRAHVFHHQKSIYRQVTLPFEAARYHSLIVDSNTLPDVLEITAEIDDGTIMGIRHKQFPIHGVQFHPESILTMEGKKIIQNFIHCCEEYHHDYSIAA